MPTTRRRLPRGRMSAGGISEADYIYFTWGSYFEAEGYKVGKTEGELKAFWKEHREAILDRYFKEDRHAGQRPWPFFKWDVTAPRLKVGTEEYWGPMTRDGMPKEPNVEDVFEDDEQYLKRLGLLQDWEIGKLKKISERNDPLRDVARPV